MQIQVKFIELGYQNHHTFFKYGLYMYKMEHNKEQIKRAYLCHRIVDQDRQD